MIICAPSNKEMANMHIEQSKEYFQMFIGKPLLLFFSLVLFLCGVIVGGIGWFNFHEYILGYYD